MCCAVSQHRAHGQSIAYRQLTKTMFVDPSRIFAVTRARVVGGAFSRSAASQISGRIAPSRTSKRKFASFRSLNDGREAAAGGAGKPTSRRYWPVKDVSFSCCSKWLHAGMFGAGMNEEVELDEDGPAL